MSLTLATPRTFARWTIGSTTLAAATDAEYRGGVQYEAALLADAALGGAWVEDVVRPQDITLTVSDRPDLLEELLTEDGEVLLTEAGDPMLTTFGPFDSLRGASTIGLEVEVDVVTSLTFDDGSTTEHVHSQKLSVRGRRRLAGAIELQLADLDDQRLNALYPQRTYTVEDWPGLLTSDAGRAVPNIRGIAPKLPCVLVDDADPFRYIVAEGTVTVLTVYRGGRNGDRVVDVAEYTTGTGSTPWPHTWVEFTSEQRDFDGSLYTITADVQTTAAGINVATEVGTLLTAAGVTVDAGDLATAEAFATAQDLLVDLDHGRDGQRRIRAILEDLLWVLRGTLLRKSDGSYGLTVDDSAASAYTLDEDAGDLIEVESVDEAARPAAVGIRYRPSPRNPNALQHELTRTVSNGTGSAEKPRDLRYVRRHGTADRCTAYRAARAGLPDRLVARVYAIDVQLGTVLTISSAAFGLTASTWRVRQLQRIPGGARIEATPYDASLTAYTAATLPADATDDYQPDYSDTPPDEPSALAITAGSTALAADGPLTARVTVQATPPAVNWVDLWFACIHNVTAEIAALVRGTDIGGGNRGATLTGLRPGEVYQLQAYAINAFGVQGIVQDSFNATAIGGGAAATTFTAPGYATLPPNVASCSAAQGSAKLIEANWTAVTIANLDGYVLERRIGAGSWSEVWRGKGRNYVDRSVSYGNSYQYRVKARDSYGNLSAAYATSSSVTLTTGTIGGGSSNNDIGSTTVATINRTAVTTVSKATSNLNVVTFDPEMVWNETLTHSLGKVPVGLITAPAGCVGSVNDATSTNIEVTMITGVTFTEDGGSTISETVVAIGSTAVSINSGGSGNTGTQSFAGDPHTHTMPNHTHTSPSHTHTATAHSHTASLHAHQIMPPEVSDTVTVDLW